MTAPLDAPTNPLNATTKAESAVRKRRRRAPAGGAADDCFACSKRNVKCDRRRPYCSQCLEVGNECSGYKTQLTWGVGVASRGKLRGLSLPIAKAPPVKPVPKTSPTRSKSGNLQNGNQWNEQGDISPRTHPNELNIPPREHHLSASMPTTPYHPFDLAHISQGESVPSISAFFRNSMPFSPGLHSDSIPRFAKLGPGMSHASEHHLSSSIDSLSEIDYLSPMSHSFPREDMPFVHSPTVMYETFPSHHSPVPQSPISSILDQQRSAPTSCPSLVYAPSEPSSSLHSHGDHFEAHLSHKLMQECESLGRQLTSWRLSELARLTRVI